MQLCVPGEFANGSTPNATTTQVGGRPVSVDISAGQQTLVHVYGTSVTDLHVAVGSIQP